MKAITIVYDVDKDGEFTVHQSFGDFEDVYATTALARTLHETYTAEGVTRGAAVVEGADGSKGTVTWLPGDLLNLPDKDTSL